MSLLECSTRTIEEFFAVTPHDRETLPPAEERSDPLHLSPAASLAAGMYGADAQPRHAFSSVPADLAWLDEEDTSDLAAVHTVPPPSVRP